MKKAKVSEKKRRRTIIATIVLFVVAVCATLFLIKTYTTNEALNYLSEKYNVDEQEFELIDYEIARYHILQTDSLLKPYTLLRTDFQWHFKKDDREFLVTYRSNRFYDDYQLEDIENWSTQWLQNNVDSHIVGIGFSTKHIINYQKTLGIDGNEYVFDEENIFDFINSSSTYTDENYVRIYYFDEFDIYPSDEQMVQEIDDSIKKAVPQMDFLTMYVGKKDYMKKFLDKDIIWNRGFINEKKHVLFEE